MEHDDPIIDAARRWVIALASGEMAGADHERLAAWLRADIRHAEAFEAERRLWQLAGALGPGLLGNGMAAPIPAAARPGPKPTFPPPATRFARMRIAVAALAALALGVFAFSDDLAVLMTADVSTSAGHRVRYALPDGSIALLNTASALAVDYSKAERRVRLLRGEAFFEVRPKRIGRSASRPAAAQPKRSERRSPCIRRKAR